MPSSFQTAARPHYRNGRRYSLRIGGELHAPVEFDDRPENPNNLKHDACKVAALVAYELGVEVEVVKHLAQVDRVEATF